MINAEKLNSIKGLELTTGLKEENHSSVIHVYQTYIYQIH